MSWGDWLGTGAISPRFRRYRSFRRARAFVRRLSLCSQQEWARYCKGELSGKGKKPVDIPAAPWHIYQGKGWISWGDWLGTGYVAPPMRRYSAFRRARAFVRRLALRSQQEWLEYCQGRIPGKGRRPADIPVRPDEVYRDDGWLGWGDWLGIVTRWTKPALLQFLDRELDGSVGQQALLAEPSIEPNTEGIKILFDVLKHCFFAKLGNIFIAPCH